MALQVRKPKHLTEPCSIPSRPPLYSCWLGNRSFLRFLVVAAETANSSCSALGLPRMMFVPRGISASSWSRDLRIRLHVRHPYPIADVKSSQRFRSVSLVKPLTLLISCAVVSSDQLRLTQVCWMQLFSGTMGSLVRSLRPISISAGPFSVIPGVDL